MGILQCRSGRTDIGSKREEAEEGAYIKRKEQEQLKAAREKLDAAQKEFVSRRSCAGAFLADASRTQPRRRPRSRSRLARPFDIWTE